MKNTDVFAWSPSDIPDIDLSVIYHNLNVDPTCKLIKQKNETLG